MFLVAVGVDAAGLSENRFTDDRFVLVIDESDAAFDVDDVRVMLQEFNVVETEERIGEGGLA